MKILPAAALSATLSFAVSAAAAAETGSFRLAQAAVPPPPSAAGQLTPPETTPGSPRYETDGNAKDPALRNDPSVPAYQQGSGQQTGGPARELIPRR